MARYFEFTGGTIDFPTRADFSKRSEYFEDFVLGGGRDLRAYGLTRIIPQITVTYDLNGMRFLEYVIGGTGGTLTVQATVPESFYKVTTESGTMSIHDAKIDTWELTVEEGNPVRAEFTAIGKTIGADTASAFSPDFANMPLKPSDVTLTIGAATNTLWSGINVRINNALEPLCKTDSIPVEIREAGLEITGRLRAKEYYEWATESSMDITLGTLGTLRLHSCKFHEVPPTVTGFDLPETEIAFVAYPTATTCALTAFKSTVATAKW